MGADVKSIKNRLRSVDSTLHITKAMQLVASSKLKKAQEAFFGADAYERAYTSATEGMLSPETKRSIFASPIKIGITLYIVIAGDRGLAGGYNSNIIKLLQNELEGRKSLVLPIGNKIVEHLKKRGTSLVSDEFTSSEKITEDDLSRISETVTELYKSSRVDAVKIIRTFPKNVLTQTPEVKTVLPLQIPENSNRLILFEPDAETVLNEAIPNYITALLCSSVRGSFLSELYSRRNAMDSATKNAEDMIESLSLDYNRARQGAITREITEIVAGAEKQ